ncbi:hypothetical protein JCM8547_005865 [Rhodosporidiobolus lusitaniae]
MSSWLQNKHLPTRECVDNILHYMEMHPTNPPYVPPRKLITDNMRHWRRAESGQGGESRQPADQGAPHQASTSTHDAYQAVARTSEEPQLNVLNSSTYTDYPSYPTTPSWPPAPVSHSYPTPGILYLDHNLRILQPHEINHLAYNAEGYLVDANGYPVTTQEV